MMTGNENAAPSAEGRGAINGADGGTSEKNYNKFAAFSQRLLITIDAAGAVTLILALAIVGALVLGQIGGAP